MAAPDLNARPVWSAIWNGTKRRCPKCGQGKLFYGYADVVKRCGNCNERLDQYNVGLLLPFVVIMIVAHILVFIMLQMELGDAASPLIYLLVLVPLAVILPLLILPSVKGAIVGLLWSRQLSDELER